MATPEEEAWFNEASVTPVPQIPVFDKVKGVNTPKLAGMKAITIANDGTVTVVEPTDPKWYDYKEQGAYRTDGKTSIWANAQTLDDSQFVWIPRYAYKILSGNNTSTAGQIDVKFLVGTTDKYMLDGVETTLPTDYIVHPAFTFGTDKLTGIWAGKYEASNNNGKVKITPGVTSWRSIAVSKIFDNCFTMATDPTYGFTGLTNGNTHMMKNSEWGAIAYLSHSKYGRNGNEITINNSSNFITGSAGNSVSAGTNVGTTAYNTAGGYLATTTGNISGLYDMSGGSYEYVTANLNSNIVSVENATNFDRIWNNESEKAKYFEIYTKYDDTKKGDAVWETSTSTSGNTSWFEDFSYFATYENSWFKRSSSYCNATDAGLFSFLCHTGGNDINAGFRPVVLVF